MKTNKTTTEEAIKHLKNVYACGSAEPSKCLDTKCDKCEYHTDPNIEEEVFRMAIEALKYREPRKPVLYGDGYADGNPVLDQWECDKCGYSGEVEYERPNYCPNCGQRLDWSDEE